MVSSSGKELGSRSLVEGERREREGLAPCLKLHSASSKDSGYRKGVWRQPKTQGTSK